MKGVSWIYQSCCEADHAAKKSDEQQVKRTEREREERKGKDSIVRTYI